MGIMTTPWDPAEHLLTEEDIAEYLEAAIETGEPSLVAAVRGDIDRAREISWKLGPNEQRFVPEK